MGRISLSFLIGNQKMPGANPTVTLLTNTTWASLKIILWCKKRRKNAVLVKHTTIIVVVVVVNVDVDVGVVVVAAVVVALLVHTVKCSDCKL
jgi:hypothetical protein